MADHVVNEDFCPVCLARADMVSNASGPNCDSRPEAGDFSLCFNCGEILRFDESLCLQKNEDQLESLLDPGEVQSLLHFQTLIRLKGRHRPAIKLTEN